MTKLRATRRFFTETAEPRSAREYGRLQRLRGRVDPLRLSGEAKKAKWTSSQIQRRRREPILFVHETCGHQFRPQVTCAVCGEEIRADAVMAFPSPGGAAQPGTRVVARKLRERLQPAKPDE